MTKTILLAALTVAVCQADIQYSNTTTDQQFSVFYSTGFTEIGDQLQLVSAAQLDSLDTQFFNDGSDATFDATVTFYNSGAPLGSQIGSSFTVTGISIASFTSQTVTFGNLGGLSVPGGLVVMLSVSNVSAGGDIGVNFFDPPTVGTSGDTFFVANDGTGAADVSTFLGIDNVYFQLQGSSVSAVPEPAGVSLLLGLLALLACFHGSFKRGTCP